MSLAQARGDDLIVQMVIDSDSVLRLTGYRGCAGLCGSGVFLDAYEDIVNTLRSVCESLLMSFTARADGLGLKVKSFIDTGNIESVLRGRIAEQDCVLVLPGTDTNQPLVSFGCPTIIVRKSQEEPTEITVLADDEWTERLLTPISQAVSEALIHLNSQDFKMVA
jgi:hypothetical protein